MPLPGALVMPTARKYQHLPSFAQAPERLATWRAAFDKKPELQADFDESIQRLLGVIKNAHMKEAPADLLHRLYEYLLSWVIKLEIESDVLEPTADHKGHIGVSGGHLGIPFGVIVATETGNVRFVDKECTANLSTGRQAISSQTYVSTIRERRFMDRDWTNGSGAFRDDAKIVGGTADPFICKTKADENCMVTPNTSLTDLIPVIDKALFDLRFENHTHQWCRLARKAIETYVNMFTEYCVGNEGLHRANAICTNAARPYNDGKRVRDAIRAEKLAEDDTLGDTEREWFRCLALLIRAEKSKGLYRQCHTNYAGCLWYAKFQHTKGVLTGDTMYEELFRRVTHLTHVQRITNKKATSIVINYFCTLSGWDHRGRIGNLLYQYGPLYDGCKQFGYGWLLTLPGGIHMRFRKQAASTVMKHVCSAIKNQFPEYEIIMRILTEQVFNPLFCSTQWEDLNAIANATGSIICDTKTDLLTRLQSLEHIIAAKRQILRIE